MADDEGPRGAATVTNGETEGEPPELAQPVGLAAPFPPAPLPPALLDLDGAPKPPVDSSVRPGAPMEAPFMLLRDHGALQTETPAVVEPRKSTASLGGLRRKLTIEHLRKSLTIEETPDSKESPTSMAMLSPTHLGFSRNSLLLPVVKLYARLIRHHPLKAMLLYTVLLAACLGIFWLPFVLEEDFSAFIRADGVAMRNHDAYTNALAEMKELDGRRRLSAVDNFGDDPAKRLVIDGEVLHLREELSDINGTAGRRLRTANLYTRRELTFIYAAKRGNALDERVVRDIHDFEVRLRGLPEWRHWCSEEMIPSSRARRLCNPGLSIDAVLWPTLSKTREEAHFPFEVTFDAGGTVPFPIPAALAVIEDADQEARSDRNLNPREFFTKEWSPPSLYSMDPEQPPHLFTQRLNEDPPIAIRSQFSFLIRIGGSGMSRSQIKSALNRAKEGWATMVTDTIYPILVRTPEEYQHTHIYYFGDVITGYEIMQTLIQDCYWAMGSMVFVTLYMWLHIRSLGLSIASLLIIFISIPVAYVMTRAEKTTVASFISVFLITGIGSDVVFVFVDFWGQSIKHKKLEDRLTFMLVHSGRSCLATSITTSISFFANLASSMQPLREFGLFMGLCVMNAFVLVLLYLPPLIVFRETMCRRRASSSRIGDSSHLKIEHGSSDKAHGWQGIENKDVTYKALFKLTKLVSRCPITVVMVTFLLFIIFSIGVGFGVKMDQGVPAIFDEDHNQVAGKEMEAKFEVVRPSVDSLELKSGDVCDAFNFESSDCMFHWCTAPELETVDPNPLNGACWRSPTYQYAPHDAWVRQTTEECTAVEVKLRFTAVDDARTQWWRTHLGQVMNAISDMENVSGLATPSNAERVATLGFEHWETGNVKVSPYWATADIIQQSSGRSLSSKATPDTTVTYTTMGTTEAISSATAMQEPNSEESGYSRRLSSRQVVRRRRTIPPGRCKVEAMCFFGTQECAPAKNWTSLGRYNFSTGRRRLQLNITAARPASLGPMVRKPVALAVVWGIRATRFTPVVGAQSEQWSFDPSFEPRNPWAQRAMYAMIRDLPEDLRVIREPRDVRHWWINGFRDWLVNTEERPFPSRDFDNDLIAWYQTSTNRIVAQEHLWMVNRELKACKLPFRINVAKDSPSKTLLEYRARWNEYVDAKNRVASTTADRAYHTSSEWVRAEAEEAIVASTLLTIIIACVCSFVGMLLFTGDPLLAFIVLCLVIVIVLGLAFFMIAIMGWAIGPVEVISLVVFVGYSVTYALHIAHNFNDVRPNNPEVLLTEAWIRRRKQQKLREKLEANAAKRHLQSPDGETSEAGAGDTAEVIQEEPADLEALKVKGLTPAEARLGRVRQAVLNIGGATLSSAVSTIGSSVFLLFCTLNIFTKLGAVVIAVTFLSIVAAIVALPAVLMLIGPKHNCVWETLCSLKSGLEDVPRRVRERREQNKRAREQQMADASSATSSSAAAQGMATFDRDVGLDLAGIGVCSADSDNGVGPTVGHPVPEDADSPEQGIHPELRETPDDRWELPSLEVPRQGEGASEKSVPPPPPIEADDDIEQRASPEQALQQDEAGDLTGNGTGARVETDPNQAITVD